MWFQSPDFLLLTRKYLLTEQNVQIIVNALNITKDTRILDVGCGSGELTLRLSNATGCYCVGADLDEQLIAHAKQFETERLKFYQANALELPFEDSSFDIVISHTFLTSIFDAESAILEMQRVCTPKGTVCAINTDTVDYMPNFHDSLASCDWFVDYWKYKNNTDGIYHKIAMDSVHGLRPELIPQFFLDNGMEDIKLYQLGRLFSINDTAATSSERAELIELEYRVDSEKAELLSPKDRDVYLALLKKKRDYLLHHSNHCDFTGGANLMVVSPNKKHPDALAQKQEKYRIIEGIEKELKEHEVDFELTQLRADLGGISSVKITSKKHKISVHIAELTPLDAMLAAYRKFFSLWLLKNDSHGEASASMTEQILSYICSEAEAPFLALRLMGERHCYIDMDKNTPLMLDDACAKWCLPKRHIAAGKDLDLAFADALYDALATFAFKQLVQEQTAPTLISEELLGAQELSRYFNILKRYGYHIKLLDISGESKVPAVALHLFHETGSLIRYAADFDLIGAIKKCLLQIFVGKKINALLSGGIRLIGGGMSDVDMFNLMTTGKQVLPKSFVDPRRNSDLAAFLPQKNTLQALKELCGRLSLQVCFRHCTLAETTAVEVVCPDARMLWSFGRKRLNEFFYAEGLPSIIYKLNHATPKTLAALASYLDSKLRWENENTVSALTDAEMYIPILSVAMDYRLLLSSIYIAMQKFDQAAKHLPTHSMQLKCLKHLLNQAHPDLVRQLFDAQLVANAQAFIAQPLEHISFC